MKKIFTLFLFFLEMLSFGQNKENVLLESPFPLEETISRLKNSLEEKKITIFSEIKHSQLAEEAGLSMPKATLLIVGNPLKGTPLMQENVKIAIELPLKILIFEEKTGIFVSYKSISSFKKKYKLKNTANIPENLDKVMISIIKSSLEK
ncbi:MAG: DUF302 domain-containing protein [Capnocytophaga sp.]|nr:DUF302 domain-containing protein [Capnocytophaga sp.]